MPNETDLSTVQVAKRLGLTRIAVQKLIEKGDLKTKGFFGKSHVIASSEVERVIASRAAAVVAPPPGRGAKGKPRSGRPKKVKADSSEVNNA